MRTTLYCLPFPRSMLLALLLKSVGKLFIDILTRMCCKWIEKQFIFILFLNIFLPTVFHLFPVNNGLRLPISIICCRGQRHIHGINNRVQRKMHGKEKSNNVTRQRHWNLIIWMHCSCLCCWLQIPYADLITTLQNPICCWLVAIVWEYERHAITIKAHKFWEPNLMRHS